MIDNLIRMTLLEAAAVTTVSLGKTFRKKANKCKDGDKHFQRQPKVVSQNKKMKKVSTTRGVQCRQCSVDN